MLTAAAPSARRRLSMAAASAAPPPPPPPRPALPPSPYFQLAPGLAAVRLEGRGRALVTTARRSVGELLLAELPLAAAADPRATARVCAACFVPVAAAPPPATCACGYAYCSAGCRDAHLARGHSAVCGHAAALDDLCRAHGVNYPRVAAAALAHSLSGDGVDFLAYWGTLQQLVTLPVAADADALPPLTHAGYAAVRAAISARMEGDVAGFWEHAFDVRTYARLLGTLRLNSFAVALHDVGSGGSGGGGGACTTAPDAPPPGSAVGGQLGGGGGGCAGGGGGGGDAGGDAGSGGGGDAGGDAGGGGCGSSDGGCGGGGGGCSSDEPARSSSGAGGGTAVYGVSSLLNHDCEPAAEALLHAHARLEVRAARGLEPGDEVTISYLGDGGGALGVAARRARLAAGYGFECMCASCVAEAAAGAAARPAARPVPRRGGGGVASGSDTDSAAHPV